MYIFCSVSGPDPVIASILPLNVLYSWVKLTDSEKNDARDYGIAHRLRDIKTVLVSYSPAVIFVRSDTPPHSYYKEKMQHLLGRIAVLRSTAMRPVVKLRWPLVSMPHRRTTSVCHSRERCKNGWTDRDVVWVAESRGPKDPCSIWGCRCLNRNGNF